MYCLKKDVQHICHRQVAMCTYSHLICWEVGHHGRHQVWVVQRRVWCVAREVLVCEELLGVVVRVCRYLLEDLRSIRISMEMVHLKLLR